MASTDYRSRNTSVTSTQLELQVPLSDGLLAVHRDANSPLRPRWDSSKRELRVGRVVVKRFRVPAEIQELVFQTFEEDGWPDRIDDPLPLVEEVDPKYRLKATIRSLNRNRRSGLIRFFGDGTGEGICWELTGCDEQGSGSEVHPHSVEAEVVVDCLAGTDIVEVGGDAVAAAGEDVGAAVDFVHAVFAEDDVIAVIAVEPAAAVECTNASPGTAATDSSGGPDKR